MNLVLMTILSLSLGLVGVVIILTCLHIFSKKHIPTVPSIPAEFYLTPDEIKKLKLKEFLK